MTTDDMRVVLVWLQRRESVCTTDLIKQFIKFESEDEVKGAQKLFKLFLHEAEVEVKYPT